MRTKILPKHLITAVFVIAWLGIAILNISIVFEPIQKFIGREYSFEKARDEIVARYPANIKGKYEFINLNGLFVRITGGRNCNNIIKMKNGSLSSVSKPYDVTGNAGKTIELSGRLEKMGIDFLYVQCPYKTNADLEPYGIEDATNENMDAFLAELDGKVSYIDLRPYMVDSAEHIDEYFYRTDHHWNPIGAFKAFQVISEYLQAEYPDENIYSDIQNIDNWEINKKEKWFLGSRGKRTGRFFGGVDDLIWMTPKFDTEMSFLNVYKDEYLSGDFYRTLIHEEYIQEKDYYYKNAYCVYIGGDYKLVHHINPIAPVNKKVLLVRDSFSLPLQSFFSTVFSELDVIDMRYYKTGTLYEYIDESRPDLVIMSFNGKGVAEDELFGTGVNEYVPDAHETIVSQNDAVYIEAKADDGYNCISLYDAVEPGKRYTLACDSVDVLQGDPEVISVKLYDEENDSFYDCEMWDIGFCEKTGSYTWTFTAPEDAGNLKLLIYSGLAGHADGEAIVLNNVSLIQK